MKTLVSDSSVLIDLLRCQLIGQPIGRLIGRLPRLPYEFVITDITLDGEMFKNKQEHETLAAVGFRIESLRSAEMALLMEYISAYPRLSEADSSALALAKSRDWTLLAGDGLMREVALQKQIEVHGTLWVFDEYFKHGLVGGQELSEILKTMLKDPRIRLPRHEIKERIQQYRKEIGRLDKNQG